MAHSTWRRSSPSSSRPRTSPSSSASSVASPVKYHLPPKYYLTWPFIFAVLRAKELRFTGVLPKLEQLQFAKIWPVVRADKELLSYLPVFDDETYPPRNFFFQVFSTARPQAFAGLISETEKKRKDTKAEKHQIVTVRPEIWKELEGIRLESTFVSAPMSKRIVQQSKRKSQAN